MAAGDISKALLAEVRTFIDENTAAFYEDSEIYSALTNAQTEYATLILAQYKERVKINNNEELPEVLRGLISTKAGTIAAPLFSFTLPTDFFYDISVTYNHQSTGSLKPCRRRAYDRNLPFKQANSYLLADTTKEYFYLLGTSALAFETAVSSGTGGYSMNYLIKPTDIDASTDPVLPAFTFPAFLQYAFGDIINKDGRTQESLAYYQKFLSMVKYK